MQTHFEDNNALNDPLIEMLISRQEENLSLLTQIGKTKNISGNLRVDKCRQSCAKNSARQRPLRSVTTTGRRRPSSRSSSRPSTLSSRHIGQTHLTRPSPSSIRAAAHSSHRCVNLIASSSKRGGTCPTRARPSKSMPPSFTPQTASASANGVRVRSKSEVIIADALDRAGIPYRYEFPTSVKGWGTLYPDFTCLRPSTREEVIWEHFGLMGEPDYAENAVQKLAHYAASGYTIGKNLIATFESAATPLSVKQVQAYIKALLM